jgi:hypothetical protein
LLLSGSVARAEREVTVTLALAIANGEGGHVVAEVGFAAIGNWTEAEEGPEASSEDGEAGAADFLAEGISECWIGAGWRFAA